MNRRMLLLMMMFVALAHFNRISITVAGAEQIIPTGLISKERMGLIYTALLVVYTICMVPGGWFLDRFGPRRAWMVVVFGSAGFVTLTGLVGWYFTDSASLFVALLVVRGGFGVICAPLHPTAARLVGNWCHPSTTDFVNGLINAAALGGIAFTYLLFGELIDFFGWPSAFMISGGFTFALAMAWFWLGADRPPHTKMDPSTPPVVQERPADFGLVFADPSLMFLTLSYGLLGYFQYLFFYWAEFYFENQMQLSTQNSRYASMLLTLAMAAGMFAGGWLSDRTRRRFPGRWGLAVIPMLALGIAGLATALTLGRAASGVIVGLTIAMGAAGISEGSYWSTAVRLGRHYGGTAAAIMNTAGNAIGLLAPLLTPWISTHYGWEASLGLAVLVCWVAALAWLGVRLEEPSESLEMVVGGRFEA